MHGRPCQVCHWPRSLVIPRGSPSTPSTASAPAADQASGFTSSHLLKQPGQRQAAISAGVGYAVLRRGPALLRRCRCSITDLCQSTRFRPCYLIVCSWRSGPRRPAADIFPGAPAALGSDHHQPGTAGCAA